MTDTDTNKTLDAVPEADAVPKPPPDYGNGDTWAHEGPWAVPQDARPYYAEAEPSEVDLRGYIQSGFHIEEEETHELPRVVDQGDDIRAPRVVMEPAARTTLVHHAGPASYRAWLHQQRLTIAYRRRKAADAEAARVAAYLECQGECGVSGPQVRRHRLPESTWFARRVYVNACPDCVHAIADALSARLAARDAERILPDGRRAGDVATDLARTLLGDRP